jgi:hypothetical protein
MPEDMLRYKYLPFNEGSICIISEGTLKFSSPDEFNDPFDCSPEFDVEKHLEYVSSLKDLLKRAGDSLGYSPAQRIQNKNQMLKRVERATSEPNFGKQITKDVGICSLSREPLGLLMWAHYANNHTGFVVEFSIPQTAISTIEEANDYILKWLFPLKVVYSSNKPVINSFDSKEVNMEKQFLVKGGDWEYEEEERVIDYIRGHGIHTFDRKRILKSVIAGMRMDDGDFLKLESAVTAMNSELNMDVQLFKVKTVKGEFALSVPGRIDLISKSQRA